MSSLFLKPLLMLMAVASPCLAGVSYTHIGRGENNDVVLQRTDNGRHWAICSAEVLKRGYHREEKNGTVVYCKDNDFEVKICCTNPEENRVSTEGPPKIVTTTIRTTSTGISTDGFTTGFKEEKPNTPKIFSSTTTTTTKSPTTVFKGDTYLPPEEKPHTPKIFPTTTTSTTTTTQRPTTIFKGETYLPPVEKPKGFYLL